MIILLQVDITGKLLHDGIECQVGQSIFPKNCFTWEKLPITVFNQLFMSQSTRIGFLQKGVLISVKDIHEVIATEQVANFQVLLKYRSYFPESPVNQQIAELLKTDVSLSSSHLQYISKNEAAQFVKHVPDGMESSWLKAFPDTFELLLISFHERQCLSGTTLCKIFAQKPLDEFTENFIITHANESFMIDFLFVWLGAKSPMTSLHEHIEVMAEYTTDWFAIKAILKHAEGALYSYVLKNVRKLTQYQILDICDTFDMDIHEFIDTGVDTSCYSYLLIKEEE